MSPDAAVDRLVLQMQFAEHADEEAAIVRREFGEHDDLVQRLTDALPQLSGRDAVTACRALGIIGPDAREALPALEQVAARRSMLLLKSLEADAADRAIVSVRADEPDFVLEALASQRATLRTGAAEAIASGRVELSDEQASDAAETLAQMLDVQDRQVALSALRALQALGPRAQPALPRIIELATDAQPEGSAPESIRSRFVGALWTLGRSGLIVGPALAGLLLDPHILVREAAVCALRDLGPQSAEAIRPLLRALAFESPPTQTPGMSPEDAERDRLAHQIAVRVTAARALGDLGEPDERVLSSLAQASRPPEVRVRYHAVTALGRIGALDDEVASALHRALAADRAGHVRRAAARALGLIRPTGALHVQRLAEALEDIEVRKSAAWAIKQVGEAALPATPALVDAMDANHRRRAVVVQALVRIGPEVVHDLLQALHRDSRYQRIGSAEALAALGSDALRAERALQELLFDRRPDVREAAEEALEAIVDDVPTDESTAESDT